MNFKKLIIYQYEILFDILDEIKEKFEFDLFKANKNNLEELKINLKEDFLIISKIDNGDLKNQLIIKKLPIKIGKLIELINLKFLKTKMRKLNKKLTKITNLMFSDAFACICNAERLCITGPGPFGS